MIPPPDKGTKREQGYCQYCFPETVKEPACGVTKGGYYCTRPKGHRGKHVACSLDEKGNKHHHLLEWEDKLVRVERWIIAGKRRIPIRPGMKIPKRK